MTPGIRPYARCHDTHIGSATKCPCVGEAKLLTDDEMFGLEDILGDFIECRSSVALAPQETGVAVDRVRKLVGMCEGVSKDGMFARQLRRKFL